MGFEGTVRRERGKGEVAGQGATTWVSCPFSENHHQHKPLFMRPEDLRGDSYIHILPVPIYTILTIETSVIFCAHVLLYTPMNAPSQS